MPQAAPNRYTSGEYLAQHPDWHASDSPWKAAHIARMLAKHGVEPTSVCEIGCGGGGILAELHGLLGADVSFTGFDISPQAIEMASQNASERLQFHCDDLLTREGEHFDVVLCIDVFEHVEDPFRFLRALAKFGRRTVFHIPLDLSVQSVLRKNRILQNWNETGHIHFYTKDLALRLLTDTGYRVVDSAYTATALDLKTYSALQALMKLPRRLAYAVNPDVAARVLGGFSLLVLCEPGDAHE